MDREEGSRVFSLGVNIGIGAVRMDAFSLVESAKSVAFLLCGIAC